MHSFNSSFCVNNAELLPSLLPGNVDDFFLLHITMLQFCCWWWWCCCRHGCCYFNCMCSTTPNNSNHRSMLCFLIIWRIFFRVLKTSILPAYSAHTHTQSATLENFEESLCGSHMSSECTWLITARTCTHIYVCNACVFDLCWFVRIIDFEIEN